MNLPVRDPKADERKKTENKIANPRGLENNNSFVSYRRIGRSQHGLVVTHELCT